jgi:hypothetical protein
VTAAFVDAPCTSLLLLERSVFPVSATRRSGPRWSFYYLRPRLAAVVAGSGARGICSTGNDGQSTWNPQSRSIFGNSWQDPQQTYTCPTPPDCQNYIPPLPPVSAGDIYANFSAWEKVKWGLNIGGEKALNTVVGFSDTITFGGSQWLTKKWASYLAGFDVSKTVEQDHADMQKSWFYTGGEALGYVWDAAVGEAAVGIELRAARIGGKFAIHGAHHTFGSLGKLSHLQLNLWRRGVKGSSWVRRIPLPSRRNFKEIILRRW